jgi:CCR4-NOT transcriptional regulation complex NOT5 subunit
LNSAKVISSLTFNTTPGQSQNPWTRTQQNQLPRKLLQEMNLQQKNPQHVANVGDAKSNATVPCPFAPSVESTDVTVYTTSIVEQG